MVDSDRLDLAVPQEPRHPGVMGALGALVVQRSPADRELLQVGDLAVDHVGDRNTIGSSPARVDLALGGDRHADPHLQCLLVAAGTSVGRLWCCPDLYRTNATACFRTLALPAYLIAADECGQGDRIVGRTTSTWAAVENDSPRQEAGPSLTPCLRLTR